MGASQQASGWWSSEGVPPSSLTDAWQQALCASYRDWEVPRRVEEAFAARLRRIDLAGIHLVECICAPCAGRRPPLRRRRDDEPHLGIQIVLSGKERFRAGDETVAVGAGDLLVWMSDREMEFEVTERLHKVTLMAPLQPLAERLPRGARIRGGVVDGRRGLGALLFAHLGALSGEAGGLDTAEALAVKRASLELAAALLLDRAELPRSGLAQQYLRNIQDYLLEHLHEEALSPNSVAQANRISVRYLHMLFAPTGHSVSAWIQEQRLSRCRAALEDPAFDGCTLAEIGWHWGFKDPAQFSRAFKAHFGMSPRDWRAGRAMPAAGRG